MATVRNFLSVVLCTLAIMAASSPAEATLLLPGTTVTPAPLTGFSGTFLEFFETNWTDSSGAAGSVRSAAYLNENNITLDFYYQVFVDVDPTGTGVSIATFQSFAGFITDVYVRSDSPDDPADPSDQDNFPNGDVVPLIADRTGDGTLVRFSFFVGDDGTRIGAGEDSHIMVIKTDASQHDFIGEANLINGFTVDEIDILAPVPGSQVPEPGSLVLLGSGLFGIAAAIRRRRKTQLETPADL